MNDSYSPFLRAEYECLVGLYAACSPTPSLGHLQRKAHSRADAAQASDTAIAFNFRHSPIIARANSGCVARVVLRQIGIIVLCRAAIRNLGIASTTSTHWNGLLPTA